MRRGGTAGGLLLRLGVVAVCGTALAGLDRSAPSVPAGATGAPLSAVVAASQAASRPWSVRVDGWYFEFDGLAGEAGLEPVGLAPARPRPEASAFSSPYDRLIARYAEAQGFDWRLVSALIYEESGFQPDSEGEGGAYGLMQVRPVAAREVGSTAFHEPDANIRTGVRYLKYLEAVFATADGRDRLGLVLAAYNMGLGHVQDAQALARRLGYDPWRWDGSMELVLPLLEQPAVFENLPYGFARGGHTAAYVNRVLDRFGHYRRVLAAQPPRRTAEPD